MRLHQKRRPAVPPDLHHQKPHLLMIGHMYATAFNRRKLNPLAGYFQITCVTWDLDTGTLFGRPLADFDHEDHLPEYQLMRLPRWPVGQSHTKYFHLHLAKLLRDQSFDLILVDSEPWSFIRWQTWLLSRLIQPKSVFGEFSWENIERPGLKGIILSCIYRLAVKTHHFSISGNAACRTIFLKYGAKENANLVAAQLGVECREFHPPSSEEKTKIRFELGLPSDSFLIGFCGRLTASKGIPELLLAIERLRSSFPDKVIHLAMLGHGDMFEELTAFAASNPWLHLLSPRPHRDVAAFMRSLDLFILASKPVTFGPDLWEEQFGHVLIEAMAAGVPTFGSSSGAIPEVIGFPEAIFNHSDLESLLSVVEPWLKNQSDLQALAVKQRQRTLSLYSHESLARIWADFLLAQLRNHQSPSDQGMNFSSK
jgi:glycosyltransferase involved in cell wall biosynthesis